MIEIVPSILVKTEAEFQERLAQLESHVERIHIDIADGIFVPNTTIDGYTEVEDLDTPVSLEAHLMVSKPENHISHWLDTPVDTFIFHIEATTQPKQVIDAAKDAERAIGIALNPSTPHDVLADYVDQIDLVHFMTVEPGFNGAKYVSSVVEKIKEFHYMYPDVVIQVDGGVSPDTVGELAQAGVTVFVSGSYIANSDDVEAAIDRLRAAAEQDV